MNNYKIYIWHIDIYGWTDVRNNLMIPYGGHIVSGNCCVGYNIRVRT